MNDDLKDNNSDKKQISLGFITIPIFKDLLIILLIVVVGWKLLNSQLEINLSNFSFSELLALLLSLFSVALSVAFYFKANETSNQFYNNSYKFTKDMSEILGRIEAGFGEKLRHLDEGYSGIRDKFDRLPTYPDNKIEEIKKEELEVKKKEAEQLKLIENLANRAQLAKGEKEEILKQLADTSKQLEFARSELRHLVNQNRDLTPEEADTKRKLLRYISDMLLKNATPDLDPKSSMSAAKQIFQNMRDDLPIEALDDLKRFNLLDKDSNLSSEAMQKARFYMRRF